jgi:osmotically-inducible protein OsmY
VTDEKLAARVRARLGRFTSHAHAVKVSAQDGCVTLSGPVLQSELDNVLWAVKKVPGLRDLRCELQPRESFETAGR